jgi:hypothetical protein
MRPTTIFGAGLSGLLAAAHFPESPIFEKSSKSDLIPHQALLRFRSPAIGDYLNIEFKKVIARKAIYYKGDFIPPNIKVCNTYSKKVTGSVIGRSIWNIEDEVRFIAPENIHKILLNRFDSRIVYDSKYIVKAYAAGQKDEFDGITINTTPLSNLCPGEYMFEYKPITVFRSQIPGADVYQTIYYPDEGTPIYRASITGDQMIVECIGEQRVVPDAVLIADSFGVIPKGCARTVQQFGKIKPIPENERKSILFDLTHKFNIYSLGRYAIWKQVVLDDIWQDIYIIKKMVGGTIYDVARKVRG